MLAAVTRRKAGLAIFSSLGRLAYTFYRKDRNIALDNLNRAFPRADSIVTGAMAAGCFKWMGRNSYDALRLTYLSPRRVLSLCEMTDEDNLKEPCRRGRGVIVLTGHIGNWELMAACIAQREYKLSVITGDLHNRPLDRMLVSMRERHGVNTIPRDSNIAPAYRILQRGEMLGMSLDRDTGMEGIFVPFFGRLAYTSTVLASLALRSGAAVVPVAIHMQPGGKHRITILPELEIPPADLVREQRVAELTGRCAGAVEKLIRIHPQQWIWFHRRWRRSPQEETNSGIGAGKEYESKYLN